MPEHVEYHERREAQEREIAAALPEGEARERHLVLADRHADRAWLIRNGHVGGIGDLSSDMTAPRGNADHSLLRAIAQSRELLAQSHRLLAESRKDVPPDR